MLSHKTQGSPTKQARHGQSTKADKVKDTLIKEAASLCREAIKGEDELSSRTNMICVIASCMKLEKRRVMVLRLSYSSALH